MAQRLCTCVQLMLAAAWYICTIPANAAPPYLNDKPDNATRKVCYKHVGCFNRQDYTLTHPSSFPANPTLAKTVFKLYSRSKRHRSVHLDYHPDTKLGDKDQFKIEKLLIFLVHGFMENGANPWITAIKDAFLDEVDGNVIIVDWGRGSMGLQYMKAVGNTALVGREMYLLLKRIIERHPATVGPDQVHVVGFSLGAQIAGFFARTFKLLTGKSIWRITAIPCYHLRATAYFLESLRNKKCQFVSAACKDGFPAMAKGRCVTGTESGLMGYYSYTAAGRGVQTLTTNAHPDYCNTTKKTA
ncbi:pancreatic lipase-related protein 2-like isoform X2 [Dermacentor andersoni]|uniref:pancreatic lipase-related protein 2-like isoform X2 n=1 Tax=Dermacentor andersoni TaxID=34620 RepID=UPI002416BF73|nr:pancreatic lipase-related protein 2-like isoform X2 [Dermacentor andersoni]